MTVPADVQSLYRRVPWPPNEPRPHGIDDDTIDQFAHENAIEIPEQLRDWLRFSNGPCIGPGGVYGIHPRRESLDIGFLFTRYPGWRQKQWIPIAGDGCGNHYVMLTSGSPVCFIDTISDSEHPSFVVASDLWHFLRFLFRRELGDCAWPFAEVAVLAKDPALAAFREFAPLPWEASE